MKKILFYLLGGLLLLSSCDKDDDNNVATVTEGLQEQPVELQSEINEFIWKGMNHWYFWQADQDLLADTKDDDQDDFYTFLNGYSSSEDLFNDLVYQPGTVDDFSWYISNVEEQLNSFRGISKSYGIGFPRGLIRPNDADDVVIYIAYVDQDSPAERAGFKRGDIIHRVDGERMTTSNASIINKIFSQETISLGLADVDENGVVTPNGDEISITAETITSNPVHFSDVLEINGKKIGYLVYNGFNSPFNGELNEVFGTFKTANIDELVLDLRYNGGGSVLSSAHLASMINGNVTAEQDAFARLQYNSKRNANNGIIFPFFDEVFLFDKNTSEFTSEEMANRLTAIDQLYVLVSNSTASASEMIINGLRPYMPVKLIGERTVGKNEGSITVVDAPAIGDNEPYTDLENRNQNHTVGMQPIVFQVFNSRNESDYTFGFEPDILVKESDFINDIKPFGDPTEALLSAALNDINGANAKSSGPLQTLKTTTMLNIMEQPKFANEMYLQKDDLGFLKQ